MVMEASGVGGGSCRKPRLVRGDVIFGGGSPRTPGAGLGREFTFTIENCPGTNLVYQWRFNGTNITDATNAWLTLTNFQADQVGTYAVVIQDVRGRYDSQGVFDPMRQELTDTDDTLNWMTTKHGMPALEGRDRELVLNYLETTYPPRSQEQRGWQNPFLNR